ncbi:hypothetical protein B0A48_04159 [Cryoendolithus antarcticus]|uniref:Pre-mRNA-splicing factor CWC26 n=1 Tax=Cryoendolithus antarcticus TaxID=1507870 RepID=A0A1V8THY6_9PEZI|nr:hypothetical protein B0A48_04159 [Cryoendolithus antarcticus]
MALSDYLAKNYLSADPGPSKKRKRSRKTDPGLSGLSITAETEDWTNPTQNSDEDDDGPTIAGSTHQNKASKKSKWLRIGVEAPKDAEQAAADAILADAQAEKNARDEDDDEAPAVIEGDAMANGAMAGLQSAEQVTAAVRRKERAEKKAMTDAGLDPTGKAQETIYRDASGRIINVAMKRAELRAKAEEEERKKAEAIENQKGDVQKRQAQERKEALVEAKVMGVARYADDAKLNDELRERERWNDPMAKLIGSKKSSSGEMKSAGKVKGGGKSYEGAFEPNRYGIRPGWRWDGVDRGNGFERKWFAARNKAKDRKELEYMWQMDE